MKSPQTDRESQENKSQETKKVSQFWQRLLLIILPIALFFGGVVILWRLLARDKNNPSTTTVQQAPVLVEIAEVKSGDIKESSEFIASLQSLRSASIQAKFQGKVSQIFVKQGNQVKAQAPLLQIATNNSLPKIENKKDSNSQKVIQQQLQNNRLQLKLLEAQRLPLAENVKVSLQKYEKYSNLATQGAVSRETKNEYAHKLQAAKVELNKLDSAITTQQANLSKLEQEFQKLQIKTVNSIKQSQKSQNMQQYKINSPFQGTVANISVKVGDTVKPTARVVTITQNQPLEVDIPVSMENKSQLRKGMNVELINAKGENIGTAKVFFISPEANPNTRTVLIKALFDNLKGKMQAGQFAKARITWNKHPGLLIPTKAIFRTDGEAFVYVAEKRNNPTANSQLAARKKQVKLGKFVENQYHIIEGLQPGEKVVVSNVLNIRDGDVVMTQ